MIWTRRKSIFALHIFTISAGSHSLSKAFSTSKQIMPVVCLLIMKFLVIVSVSLISWKVVSFCFLNPNCSCEIVLDFSSCCWILEGKCGFFWVWE